MRCSLNAGMAVFRVLFLLQQPSMAIPGNFNLKIMKNLIKPCLMKNIFLLIFLLLIGSAVNSQFVQKVTNLNYYGSWGLNPTNLTEFNGKLYFFGTANVSYADYLLMTPDGSASAITVVKQIDTVKVSSSLNHLTALNNVLVFSNQSHIWASDGTAAGTVPIANIYATNGNFVVLNNKAYFPASTTFTNPWNDQLYVSDGTAAGTKLVKTINPTGGAYISRLFAYQGKIYFTATDGVNHDQLWISDGTAAGTFMLKKINPKGDCYPSYLTGVNGRVYFNAEDGVNGMQLWTTDGTTAGTIEITTINPTGPLGLNPVAFTPYNSKVYFAGYDIYGYSQLWATDGTTAGTVKIKTDYTPRTYSGFANGSMAVYNNKLYLNGYDSLTKTTQLWVSDGTTAGTIKVTNFSKGFNPARLYAFGSKLIMTGLDSISNGEEIFATDGTVSGTVRPTPPSTAELAPFYPWEAWVPFNSGLYFTACYTFWSDYQLCRYTEQPYGIESHAAKTLSVYPNPTRGACTVVLPSTGQNIVIEVYNGTGTMVSRQTVSASKVNIDLGSKPGGLYIVRATCGGEVLGLEKVVKE